jgi:hypothetical protein
MRKKSKRAAAALLALLATAQTPPHTYAGLQGIALIGEHSDIAGVQHGVGAGPLIQVHAGGSRLAVHLEGIPVVSIPGIKPSVAYGQATPAIGIFNGQIEYALDSGANFWIGAGETVYNQRTPLPAQAQEVSSRLAGVRYTFRFRHDLTGAHFVEALVGAAPTLSGNDNYVFLAPRPPVVRPERASEIDASLGFGVDSGENEWVFGVRTLNFAARFIDTGESADRNVGIGPMIEWRHIFKR